jgi:MYXO-CTERM domain-containing protein
MFASLRASTFAALALALVCVPTAAQADDAGTNPCGTFDFSAGLACKIEVSGGCMADCTSLKLEASCSGHCGVTADTTCTNDCGTQCVAMCDPAHLDCFAGCHSECDQPAIDECNSKHPGDDCVNQGKSQCDVHCKDACGVPADNCQEHCNRCCTGSCTTQINFDCDYSCFAEVKGGCTVQCQQPSGAIFCNGQYVHASDVEACITYLATQGITVDASASAAVTCDLTGCHGSSSTDGPGGKSSAGCSAAPDSGTGSNAGAIFALGAIGLAASRRRRRG